MTTQAMRAPGTAHLTFARSGTATVLIRAFAASPAKIIETRRHGTTCWIYTATLGGGLVGGDHIALTADVTAGSRALLTTQASTKVYRSARTSRQTLTATVHDAGLLAVVPDPIVCFEDSHFAQAQRYDLSPTATIVVVDWMTSGRHAAGERWAFSRYESRLDISRGGERVVLDAIVLDRNLDSVGERMGRFDVILTAVISGPLVAPAVEHIVGTLAAAPVSSSADLVMSAVKLRDGGALVRMAGTDVERLGWTLRERLSFLSPLVGDDLWSRKW